MRISDWSSDVCSSDLRAGRPRTNGSTLRRRRRKGRQSGSGHQPPRHDEDIEGQVIVSILALACAGSALAAVVAQWMPKALLHALVVEIAFGILVGPPGRGFMSTERKGGGWGKSGERQV